MKATGVVRRIDDLGRIAIPKEVRVVISKEVRKELKLYDFQKIWNIKLQQTRMGNYDNNKSKR